MKTQFLAIVLLPVICAMAQDDETKCCCTTYDTSVCLVTVLKNIDTRLHETYEQALKASQRYSDQDVVNLKDAERKWITYKEAACKAEYELWGRVSGGPNAHAMCIIRLTKLRIIDLKSTYLEH
jgi:uncharacterized protein YecT (DUF1311 family)